MTGLSGNAENVVHSMKILGVMSGSSLDGIDLALCRFSGFDADFKWEIIDTISLGYSNEWLTRLQELPTQSGMELVKADYDFAYMTGDLCKEFIGENKIDFIASHGHTLFHFPENGATCQIGNGAAIAARSGIPVICDFRSLDIALGGQGAPIVSMFDHYVFGHIDMLLNLGGIVNITMNEEKGVKAFDIGPCNQLLNYLSKKLNLEFDKGGSLAEKGEINHDLLNELKKQDFYGQDIPKSLDNNYVSAVYFPILERYDIEVKDKLRTCVELIAWSIGKAIDQYSDNEGKDIKLIISGGGAHNTFLTQELRKSLTKVELILPDRQFIDFKEAVMMAFLGYLRVNKRINLLSSATGAKKDSIGGAVYLV